MDSFLGEIRLVSFDYAPQDWLPCDGRLLNVQQYQALYSLLGVQFGGTASINFNLPDLRGRVPVAFGPVSNTPGHVGGAEAVQLTVANMPAHSHQVNATQNAGAKQTGTADMNVLANPSQNLYAAPGALVSMSASSSAGGNAAHNNMQPSLVLNYIICASGIYPTRP